MKHRVNIVTQVDIPLYKFGDGCVGIGLFGKGGPPFGVGIWTLDFKGIVGKPIRTDGTIPDILLQFLTEKQARKVFDAMVCNIDESPPIATEPTP